MTRSVDISIVVPVFKEVKNISRLVERFSTVSFPSHFEVIFVDDDSQDGSVPLLNQLKLNYPWIKIIERKAERSLSRSILDGIETAQFSNIVIMDGDLSHPPEKIIEMIDKLKCLNVDMVIGSRYIEGGSIDVKWPFYRKWISKGAASLAQCVLPMKIADPLSGFIAIKKESCHETNMFNAIGWKIGLEFIIKCGFKNVVEIPIQFSERQAGKSKLSTKVGLAYLKQLKQLFLYRKYHIL